MEVCSDEENHTASQSLWVAGKVRGHAFWVMAGLPWVDWGAVHKTK